MYTAKANERPEGYDANRPAVMEPYVQMSKYVGSTGAKKIGLYCAEDSFEYPLWQSLNVLYNKRIEHVLVSNTSVVYADSSFVPDYIIAIDIYLDGGLVYNGSAYHIVKSYSEGCYVLEKVRWELKSEA